MPYPLNNQELIKLQLNIALYTLDVIRKYLLEPKEQNKDLEKIGNQINADIITNFFNILCQNDIDSQIICLNNMKELYIRKLSAEIKHNEEAYSVRLEDQKIEIEDLIYKHKIENEARECSYKRAEKFLSNMYEGKDFIENLKENPYVLFTYDENALDKKLIKDYYQYASHTDKLRTERNDEGFRNYQLTIGKEKATKFEKNKKDFTKYTIIGINPPYEKNKISKRQLPTEIIKYLIYYNILKEENLKDFSTNQFGRTFESKMGDIITEEELPTDPNRAKRYNLLDFTQVIKMDTNAKAITRLDELLGENPCEFSKKIYVSTEWDKNSLENFIEYIRKNYKDYISIGHSSKEE